MGARDAHRRVRPALAALPHAARPGARAGLHAGPRAARAHTGRAERRRSCCDILRHACGRYGTHAGLPAGDGRIACASSGIRDREIERLVKLARPGAEPAASEPLRRLLRRAAARLRTASRSASVSTSISTPGSSTSTAQRRVARHQAARALVARRPAQLGIQLGREAHRVAAPALVLRKHHRMVLELRAPPPAASRAAPAACRRAAPASRRRPGRALTPAAIE